MYDELLCLSRSHTHTQSISILVKVMKKDVGGGGGEMRSDERRGRILHTAVVLFIAVVVLLFCVKYAVVRGGFLISIGA